MYPKTVLLFGFLLTVVVILFDFDTAHADPLVFSDVRALQNVGFTSVDLFTHPGAVLEITDPTHPFENRVEFYVHLFGTPSTTSTLRFTLDRGGSLEIFDRLLQAPCCNDYIESGHFEFFNLPYRMPDGSAPPGATLFTMTVDIVGSSPDFVIPSGPNAGQQVDSYTYSFYVVKPIPEPATMLLLGSGLTGIVIKVRKRRKTV